MIKTTVNIKNNVWKVLIFFFLLSRVFAQNDQKNYLFLLITFIFVMVLCINLLKVNTYKKIYKFEMLWVLICLFEFISSIAVYEMSIIPIIRMVVFLVLFRASYVIPKLMDKIMIITPMVVILSFIYSITLYPIKRPYGGIYGNPNGTGIVAIVGFLCLLSRITDEVLSKKKKGIIINVVMLLIMELIIILSDSNTALLISFVLIILSIFYIIMKKYSVDISLKYFSMIFILVFLLILGFSFITTSDFFAGSKIENKLKTGDFFSGRVDIWKSIIENVSLIGHNSQERQQIALYFSEHNDFLAVLNSSGVIVFILYIIFMCKYLYRSLKILFNYKYMFNKEYNFINIGITVTHILLAMTEDIFGLSLLLITVISCFNIGIIMKNKL